MKNFKLLIALLLTTATFLPTAQAQIEGNVTLATDYVFRGFSQTNEEPAIQGGLDYAFDGGLYIGTWASNVNFDSATSTEIDLYVGYGFDLTESISLDLSAFHFIYPGDEDDFNYTELGASFGFGDFSLGFVYSPDYFGSDDSAVVVNAGYSLGLSDNLGLDFHVGHSSVDNDDFFDDGVDSYIDYSVAFTMSDVAGADLALTLYGTDVDDNPLADERVVFSIGTSF